MIQHLGNENHSCLQYWCSKEWKFLWRFLYDATPQIRPPPFHWVCPTSPASYLHEELDVLLLTQEVPVQCAPVGHQLQDFAFPVQRLLLRPLFPVPPLLPPVSLCAIGEDEELRVVIIQMCCAPPLPYSRKERSDDTLNPSTPHAP